MTKDNKDEIKKAVREGYAKIAGSERSCCAPSDPCCTAGTDLAGDIIRTIGYTDEELTAVPEGANLGLGCGNPVAIASLKKGETVLDLGSGAGIDCFLSAENVGEGGRVIGVDMTPEMLEKARENARIGGYENVEFRLGEIEHLPVADSSVDVIISNCVINLSPDKGAVFKDAYRVLKPNGRLIVSDMVLTRELPGEILESVEAYVGCIAGAMMKDDYIVAIKEAGFEDVKITEEQSFPVKLMLNDPTAKALMDDLGISRERALDAMEGVRSLTVLAVKTPAR